MPITNLKEWAADKGIKLETTKEICEEAGDRIAKLYGNDPEVIKDNFDEIILESEESAYEIFKEYQQNYAERVFQAFTEYLIEKGEISDIEDVGRVLGSHFELLDRFFLSLAQSRKARAGSTFEYIHNSLFKKLSYPFDEQAVINGQPDFVMPSEEYFRKNPLNCIVFTAKRTLRERWRQIVTEGARGIGFFLATIDDSLSENGIREMRDHRIFVVVPKSIKEANYTSYPNVLSFEQFFEEHMNPKMNIWEKEGLTR